MKHCYFAVIFSCILTAVQAQNYRPYNTNGIYHYEIPVYSSSHFYSVRFDSAYSSGADSVFVNYKVLADDPQTYPCANPDYTNGFLPAMIASPGGVYQVPIGFDSIVYMSQSIPNQSWRLVDISMGNYIEAKHVSTTQMQVFSTADSVKVITLQVKDISGNPVPHNFNGKQIHLSKNFGLIKYCRYPYDTLSVRLTGIENGAGTQNMTSFDAFNYDVGDEFHYDISSNPGPGYGWSSTGAMSKKVLSKYLSAANDSIIYTYDRILYSRTYYFYPNQPDTIITYIHDTTTTVLDLSLPSLAGLDNLNREAHVTYPNISGLGFLESYRAPALHNNRMLKQTAFYYVLDSSANCIFLPTGSCVTPTEVFAEGLGRVQRSDNSGPCYSEWLVYYHKLASNESWGTPVNWATLVGVKEQEASSFNVYPNPFTGAFTIRFTESLNNAELLISDILGKEMLRIELGNGSAEHEIQGDLFPPGLYLIAIKTAKSTLYRRISK